MLVWYTMCFSEETGLFWPIRNQSSAGKKTHNTLSQRIFHLFIYSLDCLLPFQMKEAAVAAIASAGWALASHAELWCSMHALPTHALHTKWSQLILGTVWSWSGCVPRVVGHRVQHFAVLQIQLGHLGKSLVTFRRSKSSGFSSWRPWRGWVCGTSWMAPVTYLQASKWNTSLILKKQKDPWGLGVLTLWLTWLWAGGWTGDLWWPFQTEFLWERMKRSEILLHTGFWLQNVSRVEVVLRFWC